MQIPIVRKYTDNCFLEEEEQFFKDFKIPFRGVVHIGAHTCEERQTYNKLGIADENIVWIEGNKSLCDENIKKGIPNVYNALIADTEKDVSFHITSFVASSSIYPLHDHKFLYPTITEVEVKKSKAISLPFFFKMFSLDPKRYNIWSLDIQGAELDALKGAGDLLNDVDIIFTEINVREMYESIPLAKAFYEFLRSKGFLMTHIKIWEQSWGDALFVKEKFFST